MATLMTAAELVSKAKTIATGYNTVYCWGSFGFPITTYNITRLHNGYPTIYNASKVKALTALKGKNYFGFDCVGLIKGILWGWNGAQTANGGATYCGNGVSDIDCNAMFSLCSGRSSDFSGIVPGEFLWLQGHIGIYIGDGLAVEATAAWQNKVQITAVANLGSKSGYKSRKWTMHGKSPYIKYATTTATPAGTSTRLHYSANIRKSPIAASAKLGHLDAGATVQLLGPKALGYTQIKYGSIIGWIVSTAI